jgi:hypothetical protein
MALFGRLAYWTSSLGRRCLQPTNLSTRAFTTRTCTQLPFNQPPKSAGTVWQQVRALSRTAAVLKVKSQEAPTAQAYLASGAIAGGRDLVDVKKVLVIGSGGLSIGQAGEFDYSGESVPAMYMTHSRSAQDSSGEVNRSDCTKNGLPLSSGLSELPNCCASAYTIANTTPAQDLKLSKL